VISLHGIKPPAEVSASAHVVRSMMQELFLYSSCLDDFALWWWTRPQAAPRSFEPGAAERRFTLWQRDAYHRSGTRTDADG